MLTFCILVLKLLDIENYGFKFQTETSELAQEAIQRTLIKTYETSVIICNIYRNEEDADIVFERRLKWSGTAKPARIWEVSISRVKLFFQSHNFKLAAYF